MEEKSYKYIWRCAKCGCHFSSIFQAQGTIKQEKKCPKCKSHNSVALNDKEIYIHCKFYDTRTNDYSQEMAEAFPC